jgi:hypothetical protein
MAIRGYEIKPYANLRGAYLRGADLIGANLRGANLRGADLYGANLYGAYLYGANLYGANLYGANLRGACLIGADLYGANLRGAGLTNTKLPHFQIPDGTLVGWKKVQGKIVKLSIPSKAKRTASLVGRKCRAEYAIVKEIEGGDPVTARGELEYRVGKTVHPDSYNADIRIECTHGIHFFLTRAEAEEWV